MKIKSILFLSIICWIGCKQVSTNNSRVETLPFYNEATFTAHWLAPNAEELDTFHRISSFELINQEGETITEKNFKDKIYVVDFFFTICPGICLSYPEIRLQFRTISDVKLFKLIEGL